MTTPINTVYAEKISSLNRTFLSKAFGPNYHRLTVRCDTLDESAIIENVKGPSRISCIIEDYFLCIQNFFLRLFKNTQIDPSYTTIKVSMPDKNGSQHKKYIQVYINSLEESVFNSKFTSTGEKKETRRIEEEISAILPHYDPELQRQVVNCNLQMIVDRILTTAYEDEVQCSDVPVEMIMPTLINAKRVPPPPERNTFWQRTFGSSFYQLGVSCQAFNGEEKSITVEESSRISRSVEDYFLCIQNFFLRLFKNTQIRPSYHTIKANIRHINGDCTLQAIQINTKRLKSACESKNLINYILATKYTRGVERASRRDTIPQHTIRKDLQPISYAYRSAQDNFEQFEEENCDNAENPILTAPVVNDSTPMLTEPEKQPEEQCGERSFREEDDMSTDSAGSDSDRMSIEPEQQAKGSIPNANDAALREERNIALRARLGEIRDRTKDDESDDEDSDCDD